MRDTTKEFGYRLRLAVESHPDSPEMVQGRQKWLKNRLLEEARVDVSSNTINKWYRGLARPRYGKLHAIAELLQVDESWLALGRRPLDNQTDLPADAGSASGPVLLLAGMIELLGGKVTFPKPGEGRPHIYANLGDSHGGIVICNSMGRDDETSFIVAEPVGDNRIIGLIEVDEAATGTASYSLFDLTDLPRQRFGGFSAVGFKRMADGHIQIIGHDEPVPPVRKLNSLLSN
ncbi:hypothetical protein [Pelagovum pacificum]|uniref:HTH cro/C1-type domain-containing protein n=1 Tax=Pelagovum pacificum TaxID=2588711 RepID=A0A5C5GDR9_9RHOB|nr:hypothetical protein [Pelagovum pacificum]QQA44033.1 hypothetical protein I8N54_05505 [Pelagovum pacificum]TNY32838.1 hypothetical protein FHY64_06055 [Pelagovum pacificum]